MGFSDDRNTYNSKVVMELLSDLQKSVASLSYVVGVGRRDIKNYEGLIEIDIHAKEKAEEMLKSALALSTIFGVGVEYIMKE